MTGEEEEAFDNKNIGQEALENIINMADVKKSIQVTFYLSRIYYHENQTKQFLKYHNYLQLPKKI